MSKVIQQGPARAGAAPQAPAPPIVGAPSETQYRILKGRQNELSEQHQSTTERRQELLDQIQTTPEASRSGLEAQLAVLDQRLVQIENDLGDVGRQVVAATPASVTDPPMRVVYRGFNEEDMIGAGFAGASIMFALFIPLMVRNFRRRRFVPSGQTQSQPMIGGERIDRMEHAIDSIAVEIERVSENQRFMTRLMTETQLASSIAAVRGSTEVAKVAAEEKPHG